MLVTYYISKLILLNLSKSIILSINSFENIHIFYQIKHILDNILDLYLDKHNICTLGHINDKLLNSYLNS